MTDDGITTEPATLVDHVLAAVDETKAAISDAKRPGQPLDTLSNYARRTPLTALALAFLVGIAVARKR